ncbi:hypothetical protein L798_13598 [Zootermopsis nevadensis]|uniref:Uncharacterized protein n=1 Tax=Zootermopsis nevadensis TaxID=136037 RepID=A0A067QQG1_ZOONE|nr:hypothetical protein L798_13598 [Zootermopsis nevadensis]
MEPAAAAVVLSPKIGETQLITANESNVVQNPQAADRIITFHRQIHLSQLLIRRIFHRHKTFNAKIKQTFSPYRKENSTLHRLQNQRAKTFKKIISFYSNDYTRPIDTPFGKIQEQQR